MSQKKRILSGMRPTGKLHLGNYHGALENWVKLQEEYDCFFFIADWHALTTGYENTDGVAGYSRDVMLDWLAAGLSPETSTLFVQSHVKEHAELFLLLSMVTPVPWLERNPTYKDQIVQLENKDLSTFGFLGYPVLQAADIIIYKAQAVPVGQDQIPHVELTREIARRFNYIFKKDVFPEPQVVLAETAKVLGLDRRKMSKSYDNAIYLADSEEDVRKRAGQMITDPNRMRKNDPGNPDICNVFDFHKLYSPPEVVAEVNEECRKAGIGCVDCKKRMAGHLVEYLAPMKERRTYFENRPDELNDIIKTGSDKARAVAMTTMEEVRAAVQI